MIKFRKGINPFEQEEPDKIIIQLDWLLSERIEQKFNYNPIQSQIISINNFSITIYYCN